jgi:hypothetical protein
MKKLSVILFVLFSLAFPAQSQNSNLTLLCVAAHPDDEDGGLSRIILN